MEKRVKKTFFTVATIALLLGNGVLINAQVTIGADIAPNSDALLDMTQGVDNLSYKGMLLPRVMLAGTKVSTPLSAHVQGMFVYNMNKNSYGSDGTDGVYEGIYYNDGSRWVRVEEGPKWFYMPSFNLPIPSVGSFSFNLYKEYERQFTKAITNPLFMSSNSAVTTITDPLYTPEQLDFVVIDYDPTIITVTSITPQGVMYYNVLTTEIPDRSYINIVFRVK
ncbi:MAG: hypothetical protein FWD66_09000 [Paludibacter sp.]|nr:hypothetical protein [Paludibacter sp.]